ncbi:MAG TPA: hypothetical protein VKT82_30840 [Ktedonobacterales bacterium]|nr:hypothetical protein [Ktedonobacterales bacterium]
MEQKRRTGRQGIFSLAGWLFTDLLLAMMLIFLAASGVGSPAPLPKPTPTPQSLALNRIPLTFTIYEDPSSLGDARVKADVKNQVNAHLRSARDSGRKVGFVITFGGDIDGVTNAQAFNAILPTLPNFGDAIFRSFHNLDNPANEFDLELYFFV